jgi:hypothetical protein
MGRRWRYHRRESSYVKEQNGAAERSGGVVRQKSRALQIAAHLPDDLLPEPAKLQVIC